LDFPNYSGVGTLTPPLSVPVENTKELIQEYCSVVSGRLIIVVAVVAIMWLLEPKIFVAFDKIEYKNRFVRELFGPKMLKIMYKWIGLGLLFMIGYMIWVVS